MAEKEATTIKPVGYDDNLSLDEATRSMEELETTFSELRDKYKGRLRWPKWLRGRISKEDRELSVEILGAALPLSHQPSVTEESVRFSGDSAYERTVGYRAVRLAYLLSDMAADFYGTKVQRTNSSQRMWDK